MNDPPDTKRRLPDFIFERRRGLELECNMELAGMLITDIEKGSPLSTHDKRLIQEIIAQLGVATKTTPDLSEAAIWRNDAKPEDGLSAPFDERLLEDRARRCICVLVTSGTHWPVQMPSDLVRQIKGGVDH